MKITGVMVQYYVTCKRELWFFANGINLNYEDENILLGRLLQEKSYAKENKEVLIDNTINIDFVKKGREIIIHEIKKSSKLPFAVKAQTLYYLWYLKKNKNINAKGVIVYPNEKKRDDVVLEPQDEQYIKKITESIPVIVNAQKPPEAIKKPYCKKCSYFEFCWC